MVHLYPSRVRKMGFQLLPHDFTGIPECSNLPEYSGVAVSRRWHISVYASAFHEMAVLQCGRNPSYSSLLSFFHAACDRVVISLLHCL